MHTVLETDCFVLKGSSSGEANKQLDIFTKEFGLIRATAQGLRYLKSKLRYSLTDFSYTRVSLIRGKEYWRIVTATKKGDIPTDIMSQSAKESLFRIFMLLRRLLQGEDPHLELFSLILSVFESFKGFSEGEDTQRTTSMEEITVLRILFLLGYVKGDSDLAPFLENNDITESLVLKAQELRKKIVLEINHALQASSL